MNGSVVSLLALSLAACGPGLVRQEPRKIARQSLVETSGNASAVEKLLRGSVVNGGLWFDDPECAAGVPLGEVAPAKFGAFAKCLAALKLQASTREDELADVTVMTYGPGFEVEARVINEKEGPRLTWIGFVSRRDDADNAPTITAAALETLRTGGALDGPLDPALMRELDRELTPKQKSVVAWLKVCLDETGAVAAVHPFSATSYAAQRGFQAAAQTWAFRPFIRLGRPVPVCSMVRMTYPTSEVEIPEVLPLPPPRMSGDRIVLMISPVALGAKRIAGTKMIIPDDDTKDEIWEAKVSEIRGTFRVCVDERGKVESVVPFRLTGFPAYDRAIVAGIWRWRYTPTSFEGKPIAMCSGVTFIYTQR